MAELVKVNCFLCKGSGLTPGKQPKLGILCSQCEGLGSMDVEIFENRKIVDDFEMVATSVLAHRRFPQLSITYGEFLEGEIPQNPLECTENISR